MDAPARAGTAAEIERLEGVVAELKAQLRSVLDDLRDLRRSDDFHATKDLARIRRCGGDPLAYALEEEKAWLENLLVACDFVAAFEAGKMTLADFLKGPSLPTDPYGYADEEGGIADILDEVLSQLEVAEVPRPRDRRGRRDDPIPF